MSAFDSILLIAFGGPEKADEIRPFLQKVTGGRSIPPERVEEVIHHYEFMGGRSPLNELTFRQAEALRQLLKQKEIALPVYVGMRNWHPFLQETLAEMQQKGLRRALGIILSAFQTEASWGRYIMDVALARKEIGPNAPEVYFTPSWASHPLFIDGTAAAVQHTLSLVSPERRVEALIAFTAHSIPKAMVDSSPYVSQFTEAGRLVAEKIGHLRWSVAYQSRSGSPREPWLEPDICDLLHGLAKDGLRDVVVAPIGFVCDHVEVLYDLDIEARRVASEVGIRLHRAPTANDQPYFIAMLVHLVQKGLSGEYAAVH